MPDVSQAPPASLPFLPAIATTPDLQPS